ncbi:distal tail protein Dit [Tetragenococcus koreensis]|uniref:distal tail protein Dit n=1 Tax=Tetragenococcus koreensis TaxID=290335 RepID=UPI000F511329|nr:distal tail protein Dit [Tetragenococcus koreensis]AYW46785.1 hypothetical protein C7K43_00005 [Tetragenococcus koreensis]GEN90006.1 hypothetical protein TKO01_00520 [Tetragenococcus koreensis]
MAKIKMFYHGKSFDNLLNVIEVSRPSISREYDTVQKGKSETLTEYSDKLQEITVTAWIRRKPHSNDKSVEQLRDELLFYLTQENNDKRLIFSDRPDRYYNAKFSGQIELEYINSNDAKTEITFSCEDGYAHAIEPKIFKITENEDEERIFRIVNNGTAPARVTFDLQATRDVDSFALITGNDEDEDGQVLQIGDEDDPEITEQEPTTMLWKGKVNSKQENNWQDNIATPNYFSQSDNNDKKSRVQGSINWSQSDGVRARDFGGWNDGDTGFWHGPSITRFTRQGVQDFILYTRFNFRVSPLWLKGKKRLEQGGILEFNVRDNDDNLICGVHFRDNDNKKEVVWLQVYLADVKVWDGKVPKAELMKDKRFAGGLTIQRNGNKFYIEIIKNRNKKQQWKKTLSRYNEAAAKLEATRVDYWFAQYGGRKPLAMDVTHSNFKILNSEDEADIPNHLLEDDEVLIDGNEGEIHINGAKRPEYFTVGSEFIEVPPGETDIYLVDDGAMTGTASIEEVFI